jgi:hypothetical protein
MPHLSSLGSSLFAFGAEIEPYILFPANTLIPYNGTDPGLAEWTRYSTADGYTLRGTSTQAEIGTRLGGTNASIVAVTGRTGDHNGAYFNSSVGLAAGSGNPYYTSAGGDHIHTLSSFNRALPPRIQNITLLRSLAPTVNLPVNTLIHKETSVDTDSTAFTDISSTYLMGSASGPSITAAITSGSGPITTGSAGDHDHKGSSSASRGAYTTGSGASFVVSGGNHGHTVNFSVTQTAIASKLLSLWQLVSPCIPVTDLIVMYVGTLSSLPLPWRVCDGTNGTIAIQDIMGFRESLDWNVSIASDVDGSASMPAINATHTHASGTRSYSSQAYHSSFSWNHAHSVSIAQKIAYVPPTIKVAFIQYKG